MDNYISWAVIYDLHLAHNWTPTLHIITNLKQWITGVITNIKVLFLTGDVFDKLITYPSDDAYLITDFIRWLLTKCAHNDVMLRVLEGTRSHDWNQSRMFETIAHDNVDVRWINTIEVEYIAVLDMHVLYVPDEMNKYCIQTLTQVKELLVKKKLKQCDLCFMHGAFEYQIPILHDHHNKEEYEAVIKHFIYVGHIHTYFPRGKIIPGGSFERLCFGEEEDKGAILSTYDGTTVTNEFIPNTNAFPYITVDIGDGSLGDALLHIRSKIHGLRYGRVRIRAKEGNPILSNMIMLRASYPLLSIQPKRIKEVIEAPVRILEYDLPTITKDNLVDTMTTYLKDQDIYEDDIISYLKMYLED